MAKRKRTADSSSGPSNPAKRLQKESAKNRITHALLSHYYTEISTLRTYLLAKLPASSRIRRKKIASLGINVPGAETTCSEQEIELGKALDTTLVTWRRDPPAEVEPTPDFRWEQWLGFSQKGDESYVTLSDGLKGSIYSQSEIVDFVIWLLFSREKPTSWPKHLLCDGFRRTIGHQADSRQAKNAIPGLYVAHANQHVQALKTEPWPQLLMLLGKAGERIMIDLLVDCAIFEPIQAGKDNLYQLSGIPVSELEFIQTEAPKEAKSELKGEQQAVEVSPSEIIFVRNRMFYARAALNARGLVHFGLRHIRIPITPPSLGLRVSGTAKTGMRTLYV
ncbi:hypothetical protein QBC47DRAFT_57775 [Echria macrotheca]|uniref:Telomerase reverse transcriptase n=1 Tax=Echria macrotheca TaxID=438768 RepID=A0AAJ0B669_9PEZI|nr:hypothetical protein QBC47DRAFT_57775 [Echria macrotheca]